LKDPLVHPLLAPPEIPPGWELGPPDYVGVGTMKSGTTWWWSVLNSHPRVANANIKGAMREYYESSEHAALEKIYASKEVHFFAHYGQVEDPDPEFYQRYFPRPPGSITGE
jgi:hypothetical protein